MSWFGCRPIRVLGMSGDFKEKKAGDNPSDQ